MTLAEYVNIEITEKNKEEAGYAASSYANKETKNRAYTNALGSDIISKYLAANGVNTANIRNMHSIRKVLEEFDIADIMLPNIHIDVRVVFDEDYIFVPKSHFEYEITPDIYVVLKLDNKSDNVEFMGFFDPQIIDKTMSNKDYYFVKKENLASPSDLIEYIENFAGNTNQRMAADKLEYAENSMIAMMDNDIDETDKRFVISELSKSSEFRDMFIEFENFEMLAYKAASGEIPLMDTNSTEIEEASDISLDDDGMPGLVVAPLPVMPDVPNLGDLISMGDIDASDEEMTINMPEEDLTDMLIADESLTEELEITENSVDTVADEVEELILLDETDEEMSISMPEEDLTDMLIADESLTEELEIVEDSNDTSMDEVEELILLDETNEDTMTGDEKIDTFGNNLMESLGKTEEDFPLQYFDGIEKLAEESEQVLTEDDSQELLLDEIDDLITDEETVDSPENIDVVAMVDNLYSMNFNEESEEVVFGENEELNPMEVQESSEEELVSIEDMLTIENQNMNEFKEEPIDEKLFTENNTEEFEEDVFSINLEEDNVVQMEEEIESSEEELTFESDAEELEEDNVVQTEEEIENPEEELTFESDAIEFYEESISLNDIEESSGTSETESYHTEKIIFEENVVEENVIEEQGIQTVIEEEVFEGADETEENTEDNAEDSGFEVDSELNEIESELADGMNEIEDVLADDSEEVFSIEGLLENQENEGKIDVLYEDTQVSEPESMIEGMIYSENELKSDEDVSSEPIAAVDNTGEKKKKTIIAAAAMGIIVVSALLVSSVKSLNNSTTDFDDSLPANNDIYPPQDNNFEDVANNAPDIIIPVDNKSVKVIGEKDLKSANAISGQPIVKDYLSVNKVIWEIPEYLTYSDRFKGYLSAVGRSVKLSLSSDLLLATEYPYTNKVKVAVTIDQNGSLSSSAITSGSGSKEIDDIVLQSVKDTLNVLKPPSGEVQGAKFDANIIISF